MQIELQDISRSFGRQRIFKNLSYTFKSSETYAVLGGNGSGKSTLLTIIYSALSPSSGKIDWQMNHRALKLNEVPFRCSFSGPYFELIEELSALEFLRFYTKFKNLLGGVSIDDLLNISMLTDARHKEIRHFSSGMKQRFKLALCLLSEVDLILLDEPTSNLDPETGKWFQKLISDYRGARTLIVGSNFNPVETAPCTHQLNLLDYK
jgi:ABC-type multidrug transport system ATPase subunit